MMKEGQPKVSVIIPVYNAEKYLRECLDSVVNQTLKEIEIICVDDGSTDGSLDIIREYEDRDERIIVLHQKNRFAGVARNAGMSIATGEYYVFLDADDFFELNLLEKQYIKCKKTKADVCICGTNKYNTNSGEYIYAPQMLNTQLLHGKDVFSPQDLGDQIFILTTSAPWNKMYLADYIIRQGLRFKDTRSANDSYFVWCAIFLAERVCCVPDALVHYRYGMTSNVQATKEKSILDFCDALEDIKCELVNRNLFTSFERGFVNMALNQCEWNLKSLTDKPETYLKLARAIKEKFIFTFGIAARSDEYFFDLKRYKSLIGMLSDIKGRKISVIVPVYNVEKYLDNCLQSIIKQTYTNIEIICVNDGSMDDSPRILEKYRQIDDRIIVVNEPKNNGLLLARKHGVELAKGEYVIFVDSDDTLDSELCDYLAKVTETDHSDIIQFGVCVEDYSGDKEKKEWLEKALNPKETILKEDEILRAAYDKRTISTSLLGKAYKTGLVKRAYECIPDFYCYVGEDIYTFFYLAHFANSYHGIPTKGYYTYRYGFGVTQSNEMSVSKFEMYCRMANFIEIINKCFGKENNPNVNLCVEKMKVRLFEDCCRILKNRIKIAEYSQAEQLFVRCWKRVNVPKEVEIKNLECSFVSIANKYVEEFERVCNAYSQEKKPLISVIIPVYNSEEYLKTCIESVLNQGIDEIEIVCVDDASSDDSLAILEEYADMDDRITVISQKNGGASSARNHGLRFARGKYIQFLDSDDYLRENALKTLWEYADREKTDIIYFGAKSVFDDEHLKKNHGQYEEYYTRKQVFKEPISGDTMFLDLVSRNCFRCSVPLQFIRRDFLMDSHILFEEGIVHEDELFSSLILAVASRVLCIEDCLYVRRVHSGSVMTAMQIEKKFIGLFTVCTKLKANAIANPKLSNIAREALCIHEQRQFDACKRAYEKLTYQQQIQLQSDLPNLLSTAYKDLRPALQYDITKRKINELNRLKKSRTYRIARAITYVPQKIRKVIWCYKENGMSYTMKKVKQKVQEKIIRRIK